VTEQKNNAPYGDLPSVSSTPSLGPADLKRALSHAFLLAVAILPLFSCVASDWAEHDRIQNEQRAAYWREKGYDFNPEYMTAWAMDAKAGDIERSRQWKTQGYNFDPSYMTAWAMDAKVKDIERSSYWKAQGYDFNPDYMTAWAMDAKVKDIERSKYWKSRGYTFDPAHTTAWAMDAAVERGQHRRDPALALESTQQGPSELTEPPSSVSKSSPSIQRPAPSLGKPLVAENGSYYGEPNVSGVPKTVYVNGYFRKDGTYVRSHYRSSPRR